MIHLLGNPAISAPRKPEEAEDISVKPHRRPVLAKPNRAPSYGGLHLDFKGYFKLRPIQILVEGTELLEIVLTRIIHSGTVEMRLQPVRTEASMSSKFVEVGLPKSV